ncbi:hypothetical protein ACKI2C_48505, partial [Streptomyces brasiliscabiei]|uniref:hypothetical protein n=1 Tax=Streptomyces brasiliscabiei TaxID=2736302 RepID=UPI0038F72761
DSITDPVELLKDKVNISLKENLPITIELIKKDINDIIKNIYIALYIYSNGIKLTIKHAIIIGNNNRNPPVINGALFQELFFDIQNIEINNNSKYQQNIILL